MTVIQEKVLFEGKKSFSICLCFFFFFVKYYLSSNHQTFWKAGHPEGTKGCLLLQYALWGHVQITFDDVNVAVLTRPTLLQ